jgi:hypothetical protein
MIKNRMFNSSIAFAAITIWFYALSIITPQHPMFFAGAIFFIPVFTAVGWFKGFPLLVSKFPVTKTTKE